MNKLPTIELPPGYYWAWFVGDETNPSIQKADEYGPAFTVAYYNPTLARIRAVEKHQGMYKSVFLNDLTVEEAVPIMAQMAWMGEL